MITAEVFRKYMNQSQPFLIYLADGRKIEVPHGEHVALHPSGRMFFFFTPQAFEVFNLTMVTSITIPGSNATEEKKEK
jgi:hypothetical protein